MIEIELTSHHALAGGHFEGRIVPSETREVRAVKAWLLTRNTSTESIGFHRDDHATVEVMSSGTVEAGRPLAFSLEVPIDASPGFETPHGAHRWMVRAEVDVVGTDPSTEVEVVVSRPPEDAATIVARGPAVRERLEKTLRSNAIGDLIIPAFVLAMALGGFGLMAWWVVNPPETWDDGGGGPALSILFAFSGSLLALGVWAWVRHRPFPLRGITIEVATPFAAPGGVVDVRVSSRRASTSVGFQSIEWYDKLTYSGGRRSSTVQVDILHEEWIEVGPGDSTFPLSVPAEMPVSLAGGHLSIDHRVVAVPTGRRGKKFQPFRTQHRVVVLQAPSRLPGA